MDAFFASVEQRDNPELLEKPVAVGGDRERGVVAAASYEARKYGVRSAMPSITAKRNCPDLIFVPPRFEVYKEVSMQIREIFHEYTDIIEPLSLDEAFLDVTENKHGIESATQIARELKAIIKKKTMLIASAGVSINKFLAKIASDMDKPDGLYVIKPNQAEGFVENLEIEKIFGIGKVTAQKMHKLGIYKGIDLKKFELPEMIRYFGKSGTYYYNLARAIDNRPVDADRERKSVGAERTFSYDLKNLDEILVELQKICEILSERITKTGKKGKTLTVKIKFSDFKQITRSKTVDYILDNQSAINKISRELIIAENLINKEIRLLGVTISNFNEENDSQQLKIIF